MTPPQRTAASNSAGRPATFGSQTITASTSQEQSPASQHIRIPPSGTLRLRAEAGPEQQPQEPERRVQWAEGVVNNEGMGKKSSKVCCIYHKPRPVDESSDDSSDSSSDEDSDARDDSGAARPSNKKGRTFKDHDSKHHDESCAHGTGKGKAPKRTPNAYEQIPKNG